jgi:hypothetical protein
MKRTASVRVLPSPATSVCNLQHRNVRQFYMTPIIQRNLLEQQVEVQLWGLATSGKEEYVGSAFVDLSPLLSVR